MFVSWWVTRELRRVVSCGSYSKPTFLSRRFSCAEQDVEGEGRLPSKRALMQQEGFTEQQIKAVLEFDPHSDKLAWLIIILKDQGIIGPNAGSFISSQSRLLLRGNLNDFRSRIEILHNAGMEPCLVKKTIMQHPGLLSCSTVPKDLQDRLSFLKDVGLCPNSSFLAMIRAPSYLSTCIDTRLKPRCEFFRKRGMLKEGICQLLRNYPRIFTGSEACLIKRLEFVQQFGLDLKTRAGVRAIGLWCTCSCETLVRKLKFIESLGVSHEEAVVMVKRQPNVLCLREEHLKKKIDFVLLNASVKEVLSYPSFFTCSFEKRILPRFAIVNELRKKGPLKKHVSLGSLVAMSEKEFEKHFKVAMEEATCNAGSAPADHCVRKKKSKSV